MPQTLGQIKDEVVMHVYLIYTLFVVLLILLLWCFLYHWIDLSCTVILKNKSYIILLIVFLVATPA